jgi:hypothetical protein
MIFFCNLRVYTIPFTGSSRKYNFFVKYKKSVALKIEAPRFSGCKLHYFILTAVCQARQVIDFVSQSAFFTDKFRISDSG